MGDLSVQDPDFRRWWADRDVDQHAYGVRHCHNGLVGDLELGFEAFTPGGRSRTDAVSTVQPGSESEERLKVLASWAQPATVDV